jgi:hypothetical protein
MNAASQDNPLAYHFGNMYSRFVSLGLGDILSGPLIGLVLHTQKGRILMLTLATLRLGVKCTKSTGNIPSPRHEGAQGEHMNGLAHSPGL